MLGEPAPMMVGKGVNSEVNPEFIRSLMVADYLT